MPSRGRVLCALHGGAFTHGCPGCETAEDWDILGIVAERKRTDTGERLTIEELAESVGIDLSELEDEDGL